MHVGAVRVKRCTCPGVPETVPIAEGSRTTVCKACGGWFTWVLSSLEDLQRFQEFFANEPIGPPQEVE